MIFSNIVNIYCHKMGIYIYTHTHKFTHHPIMESEPIKELKFEQIKHES